MIVFRHPSPYIISTINKRSSLSCIDFGSGQFWCVIFNSFAILFMIKFINFEKKKPRWCCSTERFLGRPASSHDGRLSRNWICSLHWSKKGKDALSFTSQTHPTRKIFHRREESTESPGDSSIDFQHPGGVQNQSLKKSIFLDAHQI